MATTLRSTIERFFGALEAKDSDAVLAFFADDAVFVDPHYPVPRMSGKDAIADGLHWVFGVMKTFHFPIVNYFESEDGHCAAVEVAAEHVLQIGKHIRVPQTFVIETRAGLVTRLQAFTTYGQGGIGGLILTVTRLKRRLSGGR